MRLRRKPVVRSDEPVPPSSGGAEGHTAGSSTRKPLKRQRADDKNSGGVGAEPLKKRRRVPPLTASSGDSGGGGGDYSSLTSSSSSGGGGDYSSLTSSSGTVNDDSEADGPGAVEPQDGACWHCSGPLGVNAGYHAYHVTGGGEKVRICKDCYRWKQNNGENDLSLRRCVLCGRTKQVKYSSRQKCQDCVSKPTQACWHCGTQAERAKLRCHVSPGGKTVQICKGCYQWKQKWRETSLDRRRCAGCGRHKNVVYDSHERCRACSLKKERVLRTRASTRRETPVARVPKVTPSVPKVPTRVPKVTGVPIVSTRVPNVPPATESVPGARGGSNVQPADSKESAGRVSESDLPRTSARKQCWHCDASLVSPSGHSMLRNYATKDGDTVQICKPCSEWLRSNKVSELTGRCCITCGGHKNALYDRNQRCQNCRGDEHCWHCSCPFLALNGNYVRKTHYLENGLRVLICVKCDYWKKKHESVDLSRRCCVVCGAHKRVVYDHRHRCYDCSQRALDTAE